MPNATQTNNESKSLDCLYFTVGDYLRFSASEFHLLSAFLFSFSKEDSRTLEVQTLLGTSKGTCIKESLPRYSLRSDLIGLLTCSSSCSPPGKNLISLMLFSLGSWKQSLHINLCGQVA